MVYFDRVGALGRLSVKSLARQAIALTFFSPSGRKNRLVLTMQYINPRHRLTEGKVQV